MTRFNNTKKPSNPHTLVELSFLFIAHHKLKTKVTEFQQAVEGLKNTRNKLHFVPFILSYSVVNYTVQERINFYTFWRLWLSFSRMHFIYTLCIFHYSNSYTHTMTNNENLMCIKTSKLIAQTNVHQKWLTSKILLHRVEIYSCVLAIGSKRHSQVTLQSTDSETAKIMQKNE